MPLRLLTALVAALVLMPAAAFAQDPTATPGPPNNASDAVKLIYEDYRRDGKIDVCDHERPDLQDAVDTIDPDFDQDYPDFREAVEAGITRHDNGRCDGSEEETPTPTATASPDDGALPPPDDGGGTDEGALPPPDDDGGAPLPEEGALPEADPLPEEGALPPDATPVPTPAPPAVQAVPPAATPTPIPTPQTVSTKADTSKLLIPALMVALALVGAFALVFFGRRSPAWREATFRTRATWADFTDWLRLGR